MLYNCEKKVFHIYIAYCCSELKVRMPLQSSVSRKIVSGSAHPPIKVYSIVFLIGMQPNQNTIDFAAAAADTQTQAGSQTQAQEQDNVPHTPFKPNWIAARKGGKNGTEGSMFYLA